MELIRHYFPGLHSEQYKQFDSLKECYSFWNEKINVISRKDMDNFEERHVLHSLAIARYCWFKPQTEILDIGTGGGFPAIPLAILFPEINIVACDSIAKKISVVQSIADSIGLKNLTALRGRAEDLKMEFDFVVSRAVAPMEQLQRWTGRKIKGSEKNDVRNGLIALKGFQLTQEIEAFHHYFPKQCLKETCISDWFSEPFFESKGLIHTYFCKTKKA